MASEQQDAEANESILTAAPKQVVRPFVRVLEGIGSALQLLAEAARHVPSLPRQFGRRPGIEHLHPQAGVSEGEHRADQRTRRTRTAIESGPIFRA